jgi:sugar phosphate isomerase/epimerase
MADRDLKLACSDHSFPLLPHAAMIPLTAALGFDAVDLGVIGEESQLKPADMSSATVAENLAAEAKAAGLAVSDLLLVPHLDFNVLAVNHPDPDEREKSRRLFTETLDFVSRAGGTGVSVLAGATWPDESEEESMKRDADELRWRDEAAKAKGLGFSIEANMGSIATTPAAATALVEAAGIQLTLDYTHFVAQGIDESEIDPLLPHARHLHARGGRLGRLQCSAAQSTIDYTRIANLLLDQGFDGYVATEFAWLEYEGMNDTDNLSETIMLRDVFEAAVSSKSG